MANVYPFKANLLEILDDFLEELHSTVAMNGVGRVDYIKAAQLIDSSAEDYGKNVAHIEQLGRILSRGLNELEQQATTGNARRAGQRGQRAPLTPITFAPIQLDNAGAVTNIEFQTCPVAALPKMYVELQSQSNNAYYRVNRTLNNCLLEQNVQRTVAESRGLHAHIRKVHGHVRTSTPVMPPFATIRPEANMSPINEDHYSEDMPSPSQINVSNPSSLAHDVTSPVRNGISPVPLLPNGSSPVPLLPNGSSVPISSSPVPTSSSFVPISSSPVPTSSSLVTYASSPVPNSNSLVPISNSLVPNSNSLVPISNSLVPNSNSLVPISNSLVPISDSLVPNASSPVPNAVSPVHIARSPVPNARSPVPNAISPVPNASDPNIAPRAANPRARARRTGRARNPRPRPLEQLAASAAMIALMPPREFRLPIEWEDELLERRSTSPDFHGWTREEEQVTIETLITIRRVVEMHESRLNENYSDIMVRGTRSINDTRRPTEDPLLASPMRRSIEDSLQTTQNNPQLADGSLQTMQNTLQPAGDSLQTMQNTLQPAGDSLQTMQNTLQPAGDSLQTMQNTLQPADDSLETTQNTLQSADDSLETTQNTLQPADDSLETTQNTLQPADDSLQTTQNTLPSADDSLQTTQNTIQPADNALETTQNTLPSADDLLQTTHNTEQSVEDSLQPSQSMEEMEEELLYGAPDSPRSMGVTSPVSQGIPVWEESQPALNESADSAPGRSNIDVTSEMLEWHESVMRETSEMAARDQPEDWAEHKRHVRQYLRGGPKSLDQVLNDVAQTKENVSVVFYAVLSHLNKEYVQVRCKPPADLEAMEPPALALTILEAGPREHMAAT